MLLLAAIASVGSSPSAPAVVGLALLPTWPSPSALAVVGLVLRLAAIASGSFRPMWPSSFFFGIHRFTVATVQVASTVLVLLALVAPQIPAVEGEEVQEELCHLLAFSLPEAVVVVQGEQELESVH